MHGWQPSATQQVLARRAEGLRTVREFFHERGVMEVDTPSLGITGASDPNIDLLRVSDGTYLQSSPEHYMKRLLAAGCGAIYQLSHVFRAGETGRLHQPEFMMLEWYQPGYTLATLIAQTLELIGLFTAHAQEKSVQRYRYDEWLAMQLGIDSSSDLVDLQRALAKHNVSAPAEADAQQLLDLAYSVSIEQHPGVLVINDFPVAQAALARVVDSEGGPVACRFEIMVDGLELANGYDELRDADELEARMAADNQRRKALDLSPIPPDRALLAAMRAGLPACCGVAVGFDRLLMLQNKASAISDVLAFPRA